jgi:hypothetical protein
MKFLQIAKLIISLLPIIIEAVKAVEEAIPGNGKGEQKLAMVRAALESAYEVSTDVDVTFVQIWPQVQKIVTSIVEAFNAVGVFKK